MSIKKSHLIFLSSAFILLGICAGIISASDNSQYHFEANTQSWTYAAWGAPDNGITAIAASQDYAYHGSYSLKATCALDGTNTKGSVYIEPPTSLLGGGMTVIARVYIPDSAPADLKAKVFISDSDWTWINSDEITLSTGAWNVIFYTIPEAAATPYKRFGVQVVRGSSDYSDYLYVDAVEWPTPIPTDTSRYTFEASTEGWNRNDWGTGITSISTSTTYAYSGSCSMKATCDIANTEHGVVHFVSPSLSPGTTVVARVYLPSGGPTGLMAKFYIKDSDWTTSYGADIHLSAANWHTLFYTPTDPDTPYNRLGIDVYNESGSSYTGDLYFDTINWDSTVPSAIANLSALTGSGGGEIDLHWTAPGDDGASGRASNYIIKYATSSFTDSNWNDSWVHTASTGPVPATQGSTENKTVGGLTSGTSYWFAIKTQDEWPNTSAIDTTSPQANAKSKPIPAPTSLSVSDAGTGNKLSLSWDSVTDPNLDYYKVYRCTSTGVLSSKHFVVNVDSTTTSYDDTSVVNGIGYYYQVTAVVTTGGESNGSNEDSATPSGASGLTWSDFKGIQYVSWWNNDYEQPKSDSSLDDLRSTGANYVGILVTWYMPTYTSNTIDPDNDKSPTDAAVVEAINDVHARGMKVMLKPHIDVTDESRWRGEIEPSSPGNPSAAGTWFYEYNDFIVHYASIAYHHDVELFCMGCELKSMTTGYYSNWSDIIFNIRTVGEYSGPLTYAANAQAVPGDEFETFCFWDLLDYAGLDVYFPLTDHANPTPNELKTAWGHNKNGNNWLKTVTDWRNDLPNDTNTNREVIFTEIGYQSVDGANITPNYASGNANPTEQKNCYEAAFNAWNYKDWLKGFFWWDWYYDPDCGGPDDNGPYDWTSQNKSAQGTLTSWYGGQSGSTLYDFVSSAEGWVADTSGSFLDNLSNPAYSGTEYKHGSGSLSYDLDLSSKTPGGYINDAGYVSTSKNLSNYEGISLYVYTPYSIDASSPPNISVYVKTGTNSDWFESNTIRNLFNGEWRLASINFSCARNASEETGQAVTNTDDVKEIGIHLDGAKEQTGNTYLYVDYVVALGTYTGTILGISVEPTQFDLGPLAVNNSSYTISAVSVTNTGNVNETYSLNTSTSNPAGWNPSTSAPGQNIFVLNTQFNSVKPSTETFVEANHALTTSPVSCTGTKFAGNETGVSVAPNAVKHLWFELRTPTVVGTFDEQTFGVTITAGQ